jgi:hypothetical protein
MIGIHEMNQTNAMHEMDQMNAGPGTGRQLAVAKNSCGVGPVSAQGGEGAGDERDEVMGKTGGGKRGKIDPRYPSYPSF